MERSAAEARQELIQTLGQENGELVDNLRTDCASLRLHWRIYRSFFGTSKERVDMLNSISGTTALVLENSLWHEVIFRICRLSDPKTSLKGKSKNVSITRLEDLIEERSKEEIQKSISEAVAASAFAKTLRNKLLAHSDDDARNNRGVLITRGSRRDVTNAIDRICDCVRLYYSVALDTHLVTHPISNLGDDEVKIIQTIYLGKQEMLRIEAERRRHLAVRDYKALDENETRLPDWVTYRDDEFKDG
ncbi:hypothetical protein M3N55_08175 [Roseibaca sp. V10]|uniref:HEPN AbiU2-like domain-containing protein n=1 Tax=Roseinatronobacter domitianus TaxID=2940293 RepID=A0ABT0M2Q4_9RHOB|nr:hypothetical protein [Roseibaca domitiana]MCL1628705.1 hypothetical protein [Roseibaca domitiana]